MSKIPFTEDQMKLLRENPYTFNVTPNSLYLTKEFKEIFYKEYQEGKLPRQILEDHGYPLLFKLHSSVLIFWVSVPYLSTALGKLAIIFIIFIA